MKKQIVSFVLLLLLLSSFFLVNTIQLSKADNGTTVSGIITSGTIWTKANSPYTLTGAIGIRQGVTLTIQAGVIVNLNGNYIQVNGTLVAKGTSTDKIQFNGGQITFTSNSTAWNKQTNTGSIIENAILTSSSVGGIIITDYASPKLNNDLILGKGGIFEIIHVNYGAPTISNCTIYGASAATTVALSNTNATFTDNIIYSDVQDGGYSSGCGISISGNSTIERNLITHTNTALSLNDGLEPDNHGFNLIQNNTICDNRFGIQIADEGVNQILFNNFDNTEYNLQNSVASNTNVTYNWWGTTNDAAISKSIYDSNEDFKLGTVTYQPILTSPNLNAPTATAIPTATPTPTPNQATQQPTTTTPTSAPTTQPSSTLPTLSSTATETPSTPTEAPTEEPTVTPTSNDPIPVPEDSNQAFDSTKAFYAIIIFLVVVVLIVLVLKSDKI